MAGAAPRLRTVSAPVARVFSLLLAGSLGAHELRYRFAFGADAEEQLPHQGHGYLSIVTFAAGPVLALLMATWLVRLVGAPAEPRPRSGPRVTWLAAGSALVTLYGTQELLEGALASGHPADFEGVVGSGGWLALPLSCAFGALVALALRVARSAESDTRTALAPLVPAPQVVVESVWPAAVPLLRGRLLARHLAGRGPPQFSS